MRIVSGVSYPIEVVGAFKYPIGVPVSSVITDVSDMVRRPIFSRQNR